MERVIKILAIDREEIILKSIAKAFKGDNANYVVTTCNNALEGLRLVRGDTFDLVFIDVNLPGMNGLEVLRRIKSIYPEISAVIMSGNSSGRIALGETSNSNVESLVKPFTTDEIKSLVSNILGQSAKSMGHRV